MHILHICCSEIDSKPSLNNQGMVSLTGFHKISNIINTIIYITNIIYHLFINRVITLMTLGNVFAKKKKKSILKS